MLSRYVGFSCDLGRPASVKQNFGNTLRFPIDAADLVHLQAEA